MLQSNLYKEKSELIKAGIKKQIDENFAGLSIEVLVTPYGEGIRAALVQAVSRGVIPLATACASSLEAPVKDIVHGLWGNLCLRSKDEVKFIRSQQRRQRLIKK